MIEIRATHGHGYSTEGNEGNEDFEQEGTEKTEIQRLFLRQLFFLL